MGDDLHTGVGERADAVHHAGDEPSWGEGVIAAFEPAARRLCLSGTPFRSDTAAIPFLRYVGAQVVPDVEYGYGEALTETWSYLWSRDT